MRFYDYSFRQWLGLCLAVIVVSAIAVPVVEWWKPDQQTDQING